MSRFGPIVSASVVGIAALAASAQCPGFKPGFRADGYGFVSGYVNDFIVFDNGTGPALYAGGVMTMAGPGFTEDTCILRWNGNGWDEIAGFYGTVYTLTSFNDGTGEKLYAGGHIPLDSGNTFSGIGVWNNGTWESVDGADFDGVVYASEVYDDGTGPALFVAGDFTHISGVPISRVAKWNGTGWTEVGGGVSGRVYDMKRFDDGSGEALYLTGEFDEANGVDINRIASWDGSSFSPLATGLNGNSIGSDLEVFDDGSGPALYICGDLVVTVGTADYTRVIARWNGGAWSNVGGRTDTSARCDSMAVFDDGSEPMLVISPELIPIAGGDSMNLPAWNGSEWLDLAPLGVPVVNGPRASAMVQDPTQPTPTLWVSGNFDSLGQGIGGQSADHIVQYASYCVPPILTEQPSDYYGTLLESFILSAGAIGDVPLAYQWRLDGVPLVDDGNVTGATTDELVVYRPSRAFEGTYDLVVTNASGSVESDPVQVSFEHVGGFAIPVTPILTPPTPAPYEPPGTTITGVYPPYFTPTGEIVFGVEHNGVSDHPLVLHDGIDLHTIVDDGDTSPDLPPGVSINDTNVLSSLHLGPDGSVVFTAKLFGPGVSISNDEAFFYRDENGHHLMAREGEQPVGFSEGQYFWNMNVSGWEHTITHAGAVFYTARVNGPDGVQQGVWRYDVGTGASSLWAATGATLPGHGCGFDEVECPQADPSGRVWMEAMLDYTPVGGALQAGVVTGDLSGPDDVALKTGDPAPELLPGGEIVSFWTPLATESGELYLRCQVEDGAANTAAAIVRRDTAGLLSPIAYEGDPLPQDIPTPPETTFFRLFPELVGRDGLLVFGANFATDCDPAPCPCDPCARDGFYWALPGGAPRTMLLRPIVGPPGVPEGFIFESLLSNGGAGICTNARGDVLITAGLEGMGAGWSGVFGWTPDSGLFPVATPGLELEFAPGDIRTVRDAAAGLDGHQEQHALLDDGTFVIRVTTTNYESAIVSGDLNRFRNAAYCTADLTTRNAPSGSPNYGVPDGVVTAVDLLYYVNAWIAGDLTIADLTTPNAPVGDPNHGVPDGTVTAADLQYYVNLWLAGCP